MIKLTKFVTLKNFIRSTLFFAVLFGLFFVLTSRPASSDEHDDQIMKLIESAGPVPDEIINPPAPVRKTLTVGERLSRFWREKILGFRVTYASARGKACHANQRVILGAIEMYNMDNNIMLKSVSHADLTSTSGVLYVGRYLKSPITPAEIDCEYRSYGDLSGPGVIYCTKHGAPTEIQDRFRKALGLKPVEAESETAFMIAGLTLAFTLATVIMLGMLFRRAPQTTEDTD